VLQPVFNPPEDTAVRSFSLCPPLPDADFKRICESVGSFKFLLIWNMYFKLTSSSKSEKREGWGENGEDRLLGR